MPATRDTLRLSFVVLLFAAVCPLLVIGVEPAPTSRVETVLIDEKKLLSPADYKAIVEVAETYIEGDEAVYTVEALGKDVVRIKLGTLKRPGNAYHGILFMLRRTPKGWRQDQKDPASIWVE